MGERGLADEGPDDEEEERGRADGLEDGGERVERGLDEESQAGDDEEPGGGHDQAPGQAELDPPGELGLSEPVTLRHVQARHWSQGTILSVVGVRRIILEHNTTRIRGKSERVQFKSRREMNPTVS